MLTADVMILDTNNFFKGIGKVKPMKVLDKKWSLGIKACKST